MLKSFGDESSVAAGPTIVATVVAFVVGYMVIVWFLKLVTTKSFEPFVIYRIFFAIFVAILLSVGVLQPISTTIV